MYLIFIILKPISSIFSKQKESKLLSPPSRLFFVNIGINFIVKPELNSNKFKVLNDCVNALSTEYSNPLFIGESLSLSRIFNILNNVSGVNDTVKVQIVSKNSSNYSNVFFQINENMSPDGDMLVCPKNAIFELKFPEVDIKGKLR